VAKWASIPISSSYDIADARFVTVIATRAREAVTQLSLVLVLLVCASGAGLRLESTEAAVGACRARHWLSVGVIIGTVPAHLANCTLALLLGRDVEGISCSRASLWNLNTFLAVVAERAWISLCL